MKKQNLFGIFNTKIYCGLKNKIFKELLIQIDLLENLKLLVFIKILLKIFLILDIVLWKNTWKELFIEN